VAKMQVQAPNGSLIDAEEIDFDVEHEPWTVLKLKDGTTIRVRVSVIKVIRFDQWDPFTGDPQYVVQSQNQMRAQVPSKLKKFVRAEKGGKEEKRPEVG